MAAGANAKRVANLILSHGRRLANERSVPLAKLNLSAARLAEVAALVDANKIAAAEPAGKVLERLLRSRRAGGAGRDGAGADPVERHRRRSTRRSTR